MVFWKKNKKLNKKVIPNKKMLSVKHSKQYDLFSPELDSLIDNLNKRFGTNAVHFGNQENSERINKLLSSDNLEMLNNELKLLFEAYQKIDKKITALTKLKTPNRYKLILLKKHQAQIKNLGISIKKRINFISNL